MNDQTYSEFVQHVTQKIAEQLAIPAGMYCSGSYSNEQVAQAQATAATATSGPPTKTANATRPAAREATSATRARSR